MPSPTDAADPSLRLRPASADDLPAIVAMLADDQLGSTREDPSLPLAAGYVRGFEAIQADPANELLVVTGDGATHLLGVMQLTFIPSISHRGAWRALVEGVRVARAARGRGVGTFMLERAIERARTRGCRMVQLTSDRSRTDARRFYEGLGFRATHEGFKLPLDP